MAGVAAAGVRSNTIKASLKDRWYILGMTGSGKTTFAKKLTAELARIYPGASVNVLDSKGGEDFEGWPGLVESEDAPEPAAAGKLCVWRPPTDDIGEYNAWLEGILKKREPALIYIDELSSLSPGGNGASYPVGLSKVLKQGRSLGICAIILTQEAAYIPRQIRTQATHMIAFRLQEDAHGMAQAARMLGHSDYQTPRGKYGFFYRRMSPVTGETVEYESAEHFFNGRRGK